MREWIERRANSLFVISCVIGLIWPYWDWTSDIFVQIILMIATFIACFKLSLSEFKQLSWKPLCLFIILRYTLFAWLLYAVSSMIFPPDIALGILLMAALPSAAAAPAMTNIFGGQVTLTAIVTIATTIMVPFTIPLLFSFTGGSTIMPSPADLLQTLAIILLLPCALFILLRHIKPLQTSVQHYGKASTIILISIMLATVIGQQREFVLSDPSLLSAMFALSLVIYLLMLLSGWFAGRTFARDQRIALTISFGFNNAALGIAIAALHFSPTVVVVTVAAELSWALLPYITKRLIKNAELS